MKASVPKRFSCPGAPITAAFRLTLSGVSSRSWLSDLRPLDRLLNLHHRGFRASVQSGVSAAQRTYNTDCSEVFGSCSACLPAHAQSKTITPLAALVSTPTAGDDETACHF